MNRRTIDTPPQRGRWLPATGSADTGQAEVRKAARQAQRAADIALSNVEFVEDWLDARELLAEDGAATSTEWAWTR